MSILVKKPGLLTTIQGWGRVGYRRFGIPSGGVMDSAAPKFINLLLGNEEDRPVLEIHFPGPELEFETVTPFAIGGANFDAELDGEPIGNWRIHIPSRGSILKLRKKLKGTRCYMAVIGGFRAKEWLGSKSTDLVVGRGGYHGRPLAAGDRLEAAQTTSTKRLSSTVLISSSIRPFYSSFPTVRLLPGPEFESLTGKSALDLFTRTFTVSPRSNRMGFRLEGASLHTLTKKELLSTAVTFGTVQLLPDGQLVILMADHQTTGGYPRVGQVAVVDLPLVGQLGSGDKIAFHRIGMEEAEALHMQFERDMEKLRVGCRLSALRVSG